MKSSDLVQKGLHLIVAGFAGSLKADSKRQLSALKALHDLFKAPGVPPPSVQAAFRDCRAFPSLIAVINAVILDNPAQQLTSPQASTELTPTFSLPRMKSLADLEKRSWLSNDGELCATATLACSVLSELVRNNPINRQAALQAGALTALCGVLVAGGEEPLAVEVLRTLYMFVRADTQGYLMPEIVETGAVNTLVSLLKCAFQLSSVSNSDIWAQEVLSILSILAKRSVLVAQLLAENLATITQLMNVCQQPITLSLGLDILEELILSADQPGFVQQLLMQGGLRAMVRVMHIHGLGSQVVLLFARLMSDVMFRNALHSVMSPHDVSCLCQVALHAADAKDLDGSACRQLITLLLEVDAMGMLVKCTQGRCTAAAVSLPGVAESLSEKASTPLAVSVITNLGSAYRLEAAITAATLLPHCQSYLHLLHMQDYMIDLVSGALDENDEVPSAVDSVVCPATTALLSLLGFIQPRVSSGAAKDMSRSSSRVLSPSLSHQNLRSASGESQKYESVRFVVGGREFFALSWLLESSSAVISAMMTPLSPTSKFHTVTVPDVAGLSAGRQYEIFGLAVEYLYTGGNVEPMDGDLLDLWALATGLQISTIIDYCEAQLRKRSLLDDCSSMNAALSLAACMAEQGESLRMIVIEHLLDKLPELVGTYRLSRLVCKQRKVVEDTAVTVLLEKLQEAAQYRETMESGGSRVLSQELMPHRAGSYAEVSGTISAENAADWSRQLSSVFSKKLPPIKTAQSGSVGGPPAPPVNTAAATNGNAKPQAINNGVGLQKSSSQTEDGETNHTSKT